MTCRLGETIELPWYSLVGEQDCASQIEGVHLGVRRTSGSKYVERAAFVSEHVRRLHPICNRGHVRMRTSGEGPQRIPSPSVSLTMTLSKAFHARQNPSACQKPRVRKHVKRTAKSLIYAPRQ